MFADVMSDQMVCCSSCGEIQTKKNYNQHLKRRHSGGIEDACDAAMENSGSVQSKCSVQRSNVTAQVRMNAEKNGL